MDPTENSPTNPLPLVLTDAQFAILREDILRANPPAVMNVPALAKVLGVHADTIRASAEEGKIPCRKLGSRMMFVRDEVLRLFGATRRTQSR